jgi:Lipocalin-like domain
MRVLTSTQSWVISCFAALLLGGSATAASLKNEIVGAWTVLSVVNEENGKKTELFGAEPKGLFIFTADGHFSTGIVRQGRPKFTKNDRMSGTDDENKAAVQGTITTFGTYTVNDADKTITVNIMGSNFPNWDGTAQKRMAEINGDQMKYTNPTPSTGGNAVLMLKRAK